MSKVSVKSIHARICMAEL